MPGGAADGDQRIATGDEILSIDGHNVVSPEFVQNELEARTTLCSNGNNTFKSISIKLKVQGSHHRVVQLMGEAGLRGQVTMILRRKVIRPLASNQLLRYPYDVIVSRNENEGFGFVISSSQYYGSTIGEFLILFLTNQLKLFF